MKLILLVICLFEFTFGAVKPTVSLLKAYENVTRSNAVPEKCTIENGGFQGIVTCKNRQINAQQLINQVKVEYLHDPESLVVYLTLKCFNCTFESNVIDGRTFDFKDEMYEGILVDSPVSSIDLSQFKQMDRISIINGGIKQIRKLQLPAQIKFVSLSHNQIKEIEDRQFSRFYRLSELNLSHNRISKVSEMAFDHLDLELRTLDLSHNSIENLPFNVFRYAENLVTLKLNNNNLFSLPANIFDSNYHLQFLDISSNPLFGIDYATIFSGPSCTFNVNYLPCSTLKFKFIERLETEFSFGKVSGDEVLLESQTDSAAELRLKIPSGTRRWFQKDIQHIRCIDYFGNKWAKMMGVNVIDEHFKLSHLVNNLRKGIQIAARRKVFGVELQTLANILDKLNQTVTQLENYSNIEFDGNDLLRPVNTTEII